MPKMISGVGKRGTNLSLTPTVHLALSSALYTHRVSFNPHLQEPEPLLLSILQLESCVSTIKSSRERMKADKKVTGFSKKGAFQDLEESRVILWREPHCKVKSI